MLSMACKLNWRICPDSERQTSMKDTAGSRAGTGGCLAPGNDEVSRLREENLLLRQRLDELNESHAQAVRNNFAVQSLTDLPVLFLDSKLRITSHSNDFIHLTRRISDLTQRNQSIRKLLSHSDYKKLKNYLNRLAELDKLDYDSGEPWNLAYQGPSAEDLDNGFWQSIPKYKSCQWHITGQGQATAIIHQAHTLERDDCYLMSRDEFGLGDEDVRLCCKLRTPSNPEHIRDMSVLLNGTTTGKNLLCDITGYTVLNGSTGNTVGGIQRRTAFMVSNKETLEPDTEYYLEAERVGGRISRRLKNLSSGKDLEHLYAIDSKAVYDGTGKVGFTTFSGGMEISEIKIHTRPSKFKIGQFKVIMDEEVGIADPFQDMAGRTFKLRIGRSLLAGHMNYTVMFEETTQNREAERALQRSEELYRELFENINSGVAIYKAVDDGDDFVFMDFNTGAEKMESVPRGEILGRRVTEVFPGVEEFGLLAVFRRVWQTGKPENYPITFYTDEKHKGWRKNYVSKLPGGEVVAIFEDVTELMQTMERLETSRKNYKDLFNNAAVGITRTTWQDGTILAANEVAANLFGYDTVEEFLSGFKASQAYCDPGRRRELLEVLKKNKRVDNFPIEFLKRDGSKIWTEVSSRYYPEQNYLEGVVIDISERHEREQAIRKLNAELEERVRKRTHQLEQVNSELESFTYSVSHDLRTPLRGIAGFGQALLEDCSASLDKQAGQYVGRMIAASKRMGQLIDELLMLSRVSRRAIIPKRVNLSRLVGAAINKLRDEAPARKAQITIEPDIYCQADRALMETVVDNLMSNAWKFTGKRDIAELEFGCRAIDGEQVFFVRDNGAGFEKEYSNKLFQPFQRLHSQSEYEGHGVGLASVQRIIHRHGGRVWAEGKVDQGATFFFTLNPTFEGGQDAGKTDSAG